MTNVDVETVESNTLFRLIYEQAAVGLCVLDLQGLFVHANEACCRLSGRSEEQLLRRHWSELTHPDDLEVERTFLQRLRCGEGDSYTLEKRFVAGDETKFLWTEVTVSVLRVPETGQALLYVAIIVDRSDVHRTQQALRRSEEHLHIILDNIPDGLALVDADLRVLLINASLARRLDLNAQNCFGLSIAELGLPQAKVDRWLAGFQQVLATGEEFHAEYEWNGRTMEWRLVPELQQHGRPPGHILSLSRDVTDSRKAREERNQRLVRAERLDAAGRALAQAGLDSQRVQDVITEYAAKFIGGACFIALLSDDEESLIATAVHDENPERAAFLKHLFSVAPFRARGPVFGQVVGPAQPLLIPVVPEGFVAAVLRPEHQPYADAYAVHSLLVVPMRADQRVLGAVTLVQCLPDQPYTGEDQALLQELADRAALTLASAQLYQENVAQAEQLRQANFELEARVTERTLELSKANELLLQLATHDPLTGLANRREFDRALDSELRRARRGHRWLSLLMLDVDFFKRYNDEYGHVQGDHCLQAVGETIRECFRREADLPARYGGEEFAVILPDVDPEQALVLAEVLRLALEKKQVPHARSEVSAYVTASVGVVSFRTTEEVTADWCIARADAALYASKAAGRNRVSVAPVPAT